MTAGTGGAGSDAVPPVRDDPSVPPGGTPKVYLKDRQWALVQRFLAEVLNAHDVDALDRFVTRDFTSGTPEPGFDADWSGFRSWLEALFAGFPDMRWEAALMLYEEDTIVIRLVGTGTHAGVFRGVAATGRPVRLEAVHIIGVRDGRMATHYRVADELSLMEQITGA